MSEHVAIGPNGGTLLGFLAAIGTIAALDLAWPDRSVRLSWTFAAVGWRAVFEVDGETDEDEISKTLLETCRGSESAEFNSLGDDLSVSPELFRSVAAAAAREATATNRRWADFVSAFGCEMPGEEKTIDDTALRTMSGAGHQHFLKSMRDLAAMTTVDDFRRALFEPWGYADERPTMRWDAVDDRRYALRADDPSGSRDAPIRTVRGANRLAIEALPLLPAIPSRRRVETTGFLYRSKSYKDGRRLRWPIWNVPCTRPVVASLLSSNEVVREELNAGRLRAMGVREVFASTRLTVGKLRTFTPAIALIGGSQSD